MKLRSVFNSPVTAGLLAFTLATSLAACGGSEKAAVADGGWDEIVAAAEKEGEVVFYNGSTDQQGERLVKAFNKVYPDIEVKAERGGAEMIARVEAQIGSGTDGADVYLLGDEEWFQRHEGDLLPMAGSNPDELMDGAWWVEDKAVAVTGAPYSMFVWNTDTFPNGFKTYDDFLEPGTTGKVGFRGDASKSAAGFLDFLENEVDPNWLKEFGELNPKLYPSVVPATQAVASGEIGATPASLPPVVFDLKESGAPIDYAYPSPGYAFDYGIAALKNAHRPNAAVVFADFAASPEGQAALNSDDYGIAWREGIEGSIDPEGWTRLDAPKFTPEVIEQWNATISDELK